MFNVVTYHRIGHWLKQRGVPLLPRLVDYFIRLVFSAWIPSSARLGKNVRFGYGALGVVVHGQARIGDHVLIAQNVTIAGKNNHVPSIGNFVYVGAGAKILGDVTIGDGCIIGANSVVLKDVPSGCIVGGIPAKVLKENIDPAEYEAYFGPAAKQPRMAFLP